MSKPEKKKKKKVNHLSFKECEEIIERMGGADECLFLQHVMVRYHELQAKKMFDKN